MGLQHHISNTKAEGIVADMVLNAFFNSLKPRPVAMPCERFGTVLQPDCYMTMYTDSTGYILVGYAKDGYKLVPSTCSASLSEYINSVLQFFYLEYSWFDVVSCDAVKQIIPIDTLMQIK